MDSCIDLIDQGMVIRILSTALVFTVLHFIIKSGNKFFNKYFLLIFPAILLLLDHFDTLKIMYKNECYKYMYIETRQNKPNNYTLLYYNSIDKSLDTLSYIVAYFMFNLDNVFSYFLIYRIIGILLYMLTLNSKWFIIFFDFMKEYLIYYYFFNNNYKYLWIFIVLKIYFEIYFHATK